MSHPFSLVFYNTENFYDTIDDPETMDDEYTPEGKLNWTESRFNRKVRNISKVLKNVLHPNFSDIIALAEVENLYVLERLIRHENLSQNPYRVIHHKNALENAYQIVHYDSPDERGSDVALIYNSNTFEVIHSEPILVHLDGVENRTRDILYVKGKTKNKKELHILITHFPSRREGTEKSEHRRLFVASVLKKQADKILRENPDANLIILGDFNDEPDNRSIQSVIKAREPRMPYSKEELYNLMYDRMKRGIGSTFYKEWLLFDQIIVSGNLLFEESGFICKPQYAEVYNPRYLFFHDKNTNMLQLNRTYSNKYHGGYSDHLPVFLKMQLIFNHSN